MAINDKFEITPAVTDTSSDIDITWTSNEPTAATIQTIADGDAPTPLETGQYIQNINTEFSKLRATVAALQASIDS